MHKDLLPRNPPAAISIPVEIRGVRRNWVLVGNEMGDGNVAYLGTPIGARGYPPVTVHMDGGIDGVAGLLQVYSNGKKPNEISAETADRLKLRAYADVMRAVAATSIEEGIANLEGLVERLIRGTKLGILPNTEDDVQRLLRAQLPSHIGKAVSDAGMCVLLVNPGSMVHGFTHNTKVRVTPDGWDSDSAYVLACSGMPGWTEFVLSDFGVGLRLV